MTDQLEILKAEMAAALEREDFETAARVRDQLATLDPDGPPRIRRGVPGAMGLGTDQPTPRRPDGWTPPPKPYLGVANVKRGGRRRT